MDEVILSYRFYDKDKEVCSKHNKTLDEVGSWKRTEMQLRDDKAHAFAMTFKDRPLELGELAFGLLANNLRFVVPNSDGKPMHIRMFQVTVPVLVPAQWSLRSLAYITASSRTIPN